MDDERDRMARRAVFSVRNIDCVTCAMAIEKKLKKVDSIKEVGSAVMLNKVFVDYDGSRVGISEIKKAIKDAGYASHVTSDDDQVH